MRPSVPILVVLCLLTTSVTNAQISLSSVPTSGCVGNALGTATFTTDLSLQTGSQLISAGNFWNQAGAVWTFSTDTDGVEFRILGIPGFGAGFGAASDISKADESALDINNSKKEWTLTVPGTPPSGQYDITFEALNIVSALPSSAISSTIVGSVISPSITTPTQVARRHRLVLESPLVPGSVNTIKPVVEKNQVRPMLGGAKYRRNTIVEQFQLSIKGTWGCLLNPSGTVPTLTQTSSPQLASLCANNEISPVIKSWSSYGVRT